VNTQVQKKDWESLILECLHFEKEETEKYGVSPIDRLDYYGQGELMKEFLNLLVMFRNCHESLSRN